MHYLELVKNNEKTLTTARDLLSLKISEVIGRVEFQPGYPKWDGLMKGLEKKPGAQPGVYWCNEAAYAVITELKRFAKMILDKEHQDIKWTDPDEMYYFSVEASKKPGSGVREISKEAAWNFARRGVPVLVSAPGNGKEVGHLGIVFPTNEPKDRSNPYVGQAGAKPGIRTLKESFDNFGLKPKLFLFYRYSDEYIQN